MIKCSLEIHGLFEAKEAEEGLDIRVKIGKDPERIMMVYACNLNSQEPEAGGSLRVWGQPGWHNETVSKNTQKICERTDATVVGVWVLMPKNMLAWPYHDALELC